MDKVIIIDGIDVSECEHFGIDSMELCKINFDNNYFSNGIPCAEKCSNHSDCYYKQLKRLRHYQAEFEHELMNDYTYDGYISPNGFTPIDVIKHIKSELKRLDQENERLKARLRPLEDSYFKGLSSIQITELAKKSIRITAENRKLEHALQEIKEICKNSHTSASEDYYRTADKIQTIINKIIGVE